MNRYFNWIDKSLISDPLFAGIIAGVFTFIMKWIDDWLITKDKFAFFKYLKSVVFTGAVVSLALYLSQNFGSAKNTLVGGNKTNELMKFNQTFLSNIGENIYTDF